MTIPKTVCFGVEFRSGGYTKQKEGVANRTIKRTPVLAYMDVVTRRPPFLYFFRQQRSTID